MEERSDGILLKPAGSGIDKLSWEATAREMAASNEDWTEWNVVDDDGLATAPWKPEKPRRARGGKRRQPRRRK